MHATPTLDSTTRASITPALPLPISGRTHAKITALQPTANPHEFTATRHDGLVSRPMRLVARNPNLTAAFAEARGQAYECADHHGQPFLYLGPRPGLRGGAPGDISRSDLVRQLRASGDDDLKKLADIINDQSAYEYVHFEPKNTGPISFSLILKALESGQCPQGLSIVLSDINIGATGTTALAQALQSGKCPAGLSLVLLSINIGDTGAAAVAQALQSGKCPAGFTLALCDNEIGDTGAAAIAQVLQSGNCPGGLCLVLDLCEVESGTAVITQALQTYRAKQTQLTQQLKQQLESGSSQNPDLWQQLSYILPATSADFDHRYRATITISGKAYNGNDCFVEAARLRQRAAATPQAAAVAQTASQSTEPEHLLPSTQTAPPVQAQAITAEAAALLPAATQVIAITPPIASTPIVQAVMQSLHSATPSQAQAISASVCARADAILIEDQAAFDAALQFFNRNGAPGLESLLAQQDNIERACTLVIDIPPELNGKPAALHEYYRAFNSAFDQLYISARVTGSGLFTMQSRAASQVRTANTTVDSLKSMASYLPDALQTMAMAMPFPASAVAAVMSSAWIYQRNTQVLNSLNAFAELMHPHIFEHNLIAKQVATAICLQREPELLALAARSDSAKRFDGIRASITKIKDIAAKRNLMPIDHWQSSMALQALQDLKKLQRGVLLALVKPDAELKQGESSYREMQASSSEQKSAFLLKMLQLSGINPPRPNLTHLKSAPVAAVAVTTGRSITHQDLRAIESKLSKAEQKLASVETVAQQATTEAQNAKRAATAADKKATNVENRFDLLAPESNHPVPIAAGRQMYLAAQTTTSQHAIPPEWLQTSARHRVRFKVARQANLSCRI